MPTTTPDTEAPAFDIHVQTDPSGQADATALVTWALNPALLAQLEAEEVTDPHVLIVVAAVRETPQEGTVYHETHRYAVPAHRQGQTVSFSTGGANIVQAVVVGPTSKYPDVRKACLRRDSDGDQAQVFDRYTGEIYRRISQRIGQTSYSVRTYGPQCHYQAQVDDGHFAPPPEGWEWDYVSKFFRHYPLDECAFDQRKWPLRLLLPFFLIGHTLAALVLLGFFCYAGCFRGLKASPLWHPFGTSLSTIWRDFPFRNRLSRRNSFWFYDKQGKNRQAVFLFLNPPTMVLLFLVLWGMGSVPKENGELFWGWSVSTYALVSVLIHAGLLAALYALYCIVTGISALVNHFVNPTTRAQRKEEDLTEMRQRLQAVLGTKAPTTAPKTVRVRIQQFKSKHCRPFAKTF